MKPIVLVLFSSLAFGCASSESESDTAVPMADPGAKNLLPVSQSEADEQAQPRLISIVPASAQVALMKALELLERYQTDETRIELSRIVSRTQLVQNEGRDVLWIDLAMKVKAEDSLAAMQGLDEILRAFRSAPWCLEFRIGDTQETDKTIFAPHVTVGVASRAWSEPSPQASTESSVQYRIRTVAAQSPTFGVQLDIAESEARPSPGMRDSRFKVRSSDKKKLMELSALLGFFARLEAAGDDLTITEIDLDREKQGSLWGFSLELIQRTAGDG